MNNVIITGQINLINKNLSTILSGVCAVREISNTQMILDEINENNLVAIILATPDADNDDVISLLNSIKLNSNFAKTKIAMFSKTETMSDYRKALHNGVDAYFHHPYRPLKIVDWLASITD